MAITVVLALSTLAVERLSTQGQRARGNVATVIIDGREAVEGEILVRYRQAAGEVARARAEFDVDSDEVEAVGRRGARRMRSRRLTTRAMLDVLRGNPDVEYAEPNYIIRLSTVPNEPSFGSLWGLFNSGQTIGGNAGIAGADIDAPGAWNFTTGSRANVVGVIDTGVDYNHPDLAANMWTAPRAFAVVVSGLVINCAAGTRGFNAINNTCVPMDDHGHGTHVAGTIGAVGNNGIGVAGVNWVASMMALKFLSAAGSGSTSDAIKAIEFAIQAKAALGADANVRILSNSWGGGGYSISLANQIEAANNADMLFVAAAGNDGLNNDIYPHYPSSYLNANVVSVMASTNRDQRSSFSNFGVSSVDLGAPGSAILSTTPSNTYSIYNGTSMATPHVAGAAALVLSACPMNTADLKSLLLSSVDMPGALAGLTATGGRLDVNSAVLSCTVGRPNLVASIQQRTVTATVSNGPGNADDRLELYCPSSNPDGTFAAFTYLDGSSTPPASGLTAATVTLPAPANGGQVCHVRMFGNVNGHRVKLATSNNVVIPVVPATLTVNTPSVSPGTQISVTLADGPRGVADWVGLYSTSAPDSSYLAWTYLNGLKSPPAAGIGATTLFFTAPANAGTYQVRLFANDGYQRLATSGAITVAGAPRLTINDVALTEGNSGSANAIFTVTLSPVNAQQTVTVNFATANGSAAEGSDYAATSGTLTFAPSIATQTISVPVFGDSLPEPGETFVVNLSNAANATIGDAQGSGTIANDDAAAAPTVVLNTPAVAPGGVISFAVANGAPSPTDWVALVPAAAADGAKVAWIYLNGTKTAPAAPIANATLQFIAPSTTGTYDVRLFANDGYTRIARSAALTVAAGPTLTIDDVSVTEGNSGPATATFTVNLSPVNASQSVTVNFATANATATAGSDYVAASGTLTFAPNVGRQSISVTVSGDTSSEANETFVVQLSGAANAAMGDTQGIGTIVNDDVPAGPSIVINTPAVAPGGVISFNVLNGPANVTDWIGLVPAAGADGDKVAWVYLSGTKTPPAAGLSNAALQFTAPATPGSYDVRLFANDGYTRIARSSAVTVATGPALTINDVSINEGNSGTAIATFTVTLSPVNASQPVTVNYATANGTATSGSDYVATAGVLTFAPNVATQLVSVTVNGDGSNEATETFFVTLSSPAGATIGRAQGTGTIVNDDGPVGPSITINTPTVAPGGAISFTVNNGPANPTDWVALMPAAADDGGKVAWVYLNGTKSAPASGVANATLQFTAPTLAGNYDIRLFANDGYKKLATSATFTVAP